MPRAMPSAPSKSEDDYRAESDHRTLREAEEVSRDPSRMKRVAVVHKKMVQDLSRVGQKLGGTAGSTPPRRTPVKRTARRSR